MTMPAEALPTDTSDGPDAASAREPASAGALDDLDLTAGASSAGFDRITGLVRRVLGVPIAAVFLADGHRQGFKLRSGLPDGGEHRSDAGRLAMEIIPDALADPRFAAHPLVQGPPHLRFYAGIPLTTAEAQVVGTLCAIDTKPRHLGPDELLNLTDLASLVTNELELHLMANIDALTGTLSAAAFREEAKRSLALAARHGHELSCLLIDLDRFALVNDEHGASAGDAILRELGDIFAREFRTSDFVGRIGGEAFAVVLPHVDKTRAWDVSERVRRAIEAQLFETPAGPLRITASIGITSLYKQSAELGDVLQRVGDALARAKAAGGNRSDEGSDRDRRRDTRHRVLKRGLILFNARRSSIDCTVRNLSEQGAGLEVTTSVGIPADFELEIPADEMTRSCHLVWKTERKMGVAFRS